MNAQRSYSGLFVRLPDIISQNTGVMDLPPFNISTSGGGGSHGDSPHSNVMDIPHMALPRMRGSAGASPHSSAMDMPSHQGFIPMGGGCTVILHTHL